MDDRFRRCPNCGCIEGEAHDGGFDVEHAAGALVADDDFDAAAEDELLLAEWLAGPGARPTSADRDRWARAAAEGRLPRRLVPVE